MRRRILWACLAILLVQAVVQVRLASLDSATTDEAVHLSAGYTYLTRGDFRFNPEHPPLVKMLAALPLLRFRPTITPQAEQLYQQSGNFFYDSWRENRDFGEIMMYQAGNNPDQLLFWARLPMIALTLILGLAILLIAWRHWGERAALVATALYAFNPTVTGHGHLVTTDIGIALGFLLTIYSFWRLLERPSWRNCLWLGLSFGFALLTKHTAVILLPTMAAMAIWRIFDRSTTISWRELTLKSLVALVIAWAVIWAGFGWHDRVIPATDSVSSAVTLAGNQSGFKMFGPSNPQPVVVAKPKLDRLYNLVRPALVLLPGDYAKGLFMVLGHASGGHSSFLLGQTSNTGWWYYFPVLILTKTPLAELLLIAIGLTMVFRSLPKDRLALGLTIAGGAYLLVAIGSKADLGIRHIMPLFPVVFLAASRGLARIGSWQNIIVALVIWLALTFGLSFPTYLGYYNELVGGPGNGYKIATDSNLDWGQDIKRIQHYLASHPTKTPFIDYSWDGQAALDYYLGPGNYRPIESWQPGQTGPAIFGASAVAFPPFSDHCRSPYPAAITPGVFTCWLDK